MNSEYLNRMNLPGDLKAALSACPNIWFPESRQELYELCFGTSGGSVQIVGYKIRLPLRILQLFDCPVKKNTVVGLEFYPSAVN